MCYEKRETIEHMWNGCSEMRERERERERKERREQLNEDGRERGWMKDICKKEGENGQKGWKIERKFFFLELLFL
jgi:hypothetical protein